MSAVDRRYSLIIDEKVAADLAYLLKIDRYAHSKIIVLLQELDGNALQCEALIDEHYADDLVENISPFWHLQNQRYNVYRLKLLNVGAWRVLSAGDHRSREVAILAIMHRGQDYERDVDLIERLKDSYERLCFGKL